MCASCALPSSGVGKGWLWREGARVLRHCKDTLIWGKEKAFR